MSGVSTKAGTQFTWSKFFANTALMKPPSEKTIGREQHRRDDDEQVMHGQVREEAATPP